MRKFAEWTSDERRYALDNSITTDLLVDRVTLNFETIESDLSSIDVSQPFEVPPVILDEKHFGQILAYSGTANKGRWLRTLAITYYAGGKIIFQKVDDDNFKATLVFPRKSA